MAGSETANLSLSASEYFDRQCVVSTDPEDRLAAASVRYLGADRVVWASDFPHPDAAFPNAIEEFLEHSPDLTSEQLDALFWDTPLTFYRLHDRFTS